MHAAGIYVPGQTHLNSPKNIRHIFNFSRLYAQTSFSQKSISYCKLSQLNLFSISSSLLQLFSINWEFFDLIDMMRLP